MNKKPLTRSQEKIKREKKKRKIINFEDRIERWVKASSKNQGKFYELYFELAMVEGDPIEEEKVAENIATKLNELINEWEEKTKKR